MKRSFVLFTFLFATLCSFAQQNNYWQPYAEGMLPEEYGVFSISAVDENIIWATAWKKSIENFIPVDHVVKILKTTDGGANWELIDVEELPGRVSFDIHAIDENTAWISTHDYDHVFGPLIAKTEDGGHNWKVKLQDASAGIWVRFFDKNEGFAANFPDVSYTEDGGETWVTDSLENFWPNEGVLIGSGNNSCSIVGDNIWVGTSRGRIGHSPDRGKTWEFYDTGMGLNTRILSVAFKDEMNGMLLGNSLLSRVAKTTDGGKTWTVLGPPVFTFAHNLEYVPGTEGTFIACTKFGMSLPVSALTKDFGESWERLSTNIPFAGVNFSSANSGWAGVDWIQDENTPALMKWIGNNISSSKYVESESNWEVFPNPVQDRLNLSHNDGSRPSSFQIYNTIGQRVHESRATEISDNIDVSFLPKGHYYLKIGSEEAEKIIPFVKM